MAADFSKRRGMIRWIASATAVSYPVVTLLKVTGGV
jgi:hypothetical protein